jgi:hypothetical protein
MTFKELILSDKKYSVIEESISSWSSIFSATILQLKIDGVKKRDNKVYKLREPLHDEIFADVLSSFEESLAIIAFEYKVIKNGESFNGIRECKVFATFLYHFLRLSPFLATKKKHVTIFLYTIHRISQLESLNMTSDSIKTFQNKMEYILEEKEPTLECIYTVCRSLVFAK